MNHANTRAMVGRMKFEPDNPRQNMEPSDIGPDDARQFIQDLMRGIHNRMHNIPKEEFKKVDSNGVGTPSGERAKQYYGDDTYQLFSGIEAALREWDESGRSTEELKERYGGEFVRGVEIGERLAVYQGSDFEFTERESEPEDESKFTFTE